MVTQNSTQHYHNYCKAFLLMYLFIYFVSVNTKYKMESFIKCFSSFKSFKHTSKNLCERFILCTERYCDHMMQEWDMNYCEVIISNATYDNLRECTVPIISRAHNIYYTLCALDNMHCMASLYTSHADCWQSDKCTINDRTILYRFSINSY